MWVLQRSQSHDVESSTPTFVLLVRENDEQMARRLWSRTPDPHIWFVLVECDDQLHGTGAISDSIREPCIIVDGVHHWIVTRDAQKAY